MIPREAGRGRSFLGAGQYYLHDKGAATAERVAFTHTENIPTDSPHRALKWMAWTAMNAEELKRESGAARTGRACARPVYTLALSWHPEERPNKSEMIGAGKQALVALGLEEHETLMVSHTDRPHPHLHLIINTVHPETGRASSISYSRLKLSKWAEGYEQEHKVYCDKRVENNARREQGETVVYGKFDYTQINALYHASDSAQAFQAALAEHGFTLAQGRRPVIVDPDGTVHSVYRLIEGVKAKDIRARLSGLELPAVEAVQRQEASTVESSAKTRPDAASEKVEDGAAPEPFDRDQQDREWYESIVDAAIEHDAAPEPCDVGEPSQSGGSETARSVSDETRRAKRPKQLFPLPKRPPPSPQRINALQDRHHAELSRFYEQAFQARLRLKATLGDQYGAHERELRYEADRLQSILDESGPMRLWWLKLTGQIPPNAEEELNNKRLSLENIEWRRREAEQALERDAQRRRQAIESRQRTEREELRPDPDSVPGHQYRADPEMSPGPENQDEDDGPSLSY